MSFHLKLYYQSTFALLSKKNKAPNGLLVKAVKLGREFLKVDAPLIIYNDDGTYTNEILEIYEIKFSNISIILSGLFII